ncbi:MAG: aminodeoxychorismate/anthranilate synthase component II [Bacteroidales bacterium]|nr:aminodeoxychorismate/anthranilate synthase component II [Bacteroidales bacterium]
MKVLLIDNYDSFTYNLVQLLYQAGANHVEVMKNDETDFSVIEHYDKIMLSPGPGIPSEAGSLKPVIEKYSREKDMFGVCLGHQAIAEVFGAKLKQLGRVLHGEETKAQVISRAPIYKEIPREIIIGHYHSWIIDATGFPDELEITMTDEEGEVMALKHRKLPLYGVQFHPESVMTPTGLQMVKNWLEL